MHFSKKLPVLLALLVTACGVHPPEDGAKLDANVGKLALDSGNPEVALRLTDETLSQHPNDAAALTRRGLALTELNRLDEARQSLHKAVTIEPRNVPALLALGKVQLPVDPAEAASDFESALRQDGRNAVALNNLGIARDLLGQHAEAETAYRAALAARPEMAAARVNLALCLAMRGQADEAIAMLRPLASEPEATRKVKEDYAAVLAMAGKRQEAQQILSDDLAANDVEPALDVLASARVGRGSGAPKPLAVRQTDPSPGT
jgi:Flp pilus assembly protein TadD